MTEPDDPDDEMGRWLEGEIVDLPNLRNAGMFLQIVADVPDPRMALHLGYALLLGKPLIFVIPPGRRVPDGLVRAADALVQWTDDQAELHRRLNDAMDTIHPGGAHRDHT